MLLNSMSILINKHIFFFTISDGKWRRRIVLLIDTQDPNSSFYISQLGMYLPLPYTCSIVLYFETSQRRKDLLAFTSQPNFLRIICHIHLFLHILSAVLFNSSILSTYPYKFTMNEWAYHLIEKKQKPPKPFPEW